MCSFCWQYLQTNPQSVHFPTQTFLSLPGLTERAPVRNSTMLRSEDSICRYYVSLYCSYRNLLLRWRLKRVCLSGTAIIPCKAHGRRFRKLTMCYHIKTNLVLQGNVLYVVHLKRPNSSFLLATLKLNVINLSPL